MTLTARFNFFVQVEAPAGPRAEEAVIERDYETDDCDQAHELAGRDWPSIAPANYIEGTLNVGLV